MEPTIDIETLMSMEPTVELLVCSPGESLFTVLYCGSNSACGLFVDDKFVSTLCDIPEDIELEFPNDKRSVTFPSNASLGKVSTDHMVIKT